MNGCGGGGGGGRRPTRTTMEVDLDLVTRACVHLQRHHQEGDAQTQPQTEAQHDARQPRPTTPWDVARAIVANDGRVPWYRRGCGTWGVDALHLRTKHLAREDRRSGCALHHTLALGHARSTDTPRWARCVPSRIFNGGMNSYHLPFANARGDQVAPLPPRRLVSSLPLTRTVLPPPRNNKRLRE